MAKCIACGFTNKEAAEFTDLRCPNCGMPQRECPSCGVESPNGDECYACLTQEKIRDVCEDMAELLVEKNKAYGNSVMEPCNIFAKGLSPEQQMMVRIDDKINRLQKGSEYPGDDTIKDLAGYLILYLVMREHENA